MAEFPIDEKDDAEGKKIIRYVMGDSTPEEKEELEKRMESDDELRAEIAVLSALGGNVRDDVESVLDRTEPSKN